MKLKHILILSALIIFSGIIFYFGWIQIKLPNNTYGIAFTKSSGYINHIYEPGKFSWSKEKLIPGNFKLLKFNLFTQQLDINEQGQLPSGNIYSEYLPGEPDFSYQFNYYLSYSIKLSSFPKMVSDMNLIPDQMPDKYKEISSGIQFFVSDFYKNKAVDANYSVNSFYSGLDLSNELLILLSKKYPFLNFSEFIPSYIKIPDAILYNKAKEIYLYSIELENKVISETKIKIAEQKILDNANFETLTKYGQLLKDYPSLIDLFSVIDFNSDTIFPKLNIELPENIVD